MPSSIKAPKERGSNAVPFVFRFGEGYVAFLRFRQPVSSADLKKVLQKYLPQAAVSSRQATAARLLLPRSQDMALSSSFNKVKLIAEELKATDYTLTQSSLDQVCIVKLLSVRLLFVEEYSSHLHAGTFYVVLCWGLKFNCVDRVGTFV